MSLQTRLDKLEAVCGISSEDMCFCPDAVRLIGTEFHKICFRCGQAINLSTWGNWRVFYPEVERNFFAFGMWRDDENRLVDKANGYFLARLPEALAGVKR